MSDEQIKWYKNNYVTLKLKWTALVWPDKRS